MKQRNPKRIIYMCLAGVFAALVFVAGICLIIHTMKKREY